MWIQKLLEPHQTAPFFIALLFYSICQNKSFLSFLLRASPSCLYELIETLVETFKYIPMGNVIGFSLVSFEVCLWQLHVFFKH